MAGRTQPAPARWQPHIVALVCNWCTYAGADLAGTTRLAYPPSVRIVRFPCTGRISPLHVIRVFEQGADGVLVSGCHPGDCHYVHGNLVARRRAAVFRSLMEILGLDGRRLHFSWVSASEGRKWARIVDETTAAVREAGPIEPWGTHPDGELPAPADLPVTPPPPRSRPAVKDSAAMTRHLRELAAGLLADGRAAVVLGHRAGPLPGRTAPAFVTRAEETENLIWNDRCCANLAAYLPRVVAHRERAAIVVRQCDARSVAGLLQEQQLKREDLVLVGIDCPGVWLGDNLAPKCYTCDGRAPASCDVFVTTDGAATEPPRPAATRATADDPRDAEIAHLGALSSGQRRAYWQRQLARCLRCYACRAVCPMCYCTTCISEKHRPQLIATAIDGKGNSAWNAIRAFHLAGRCIGCDECARACPAGIRLDLLNRALALEVEDRFAYRAGEDGNSPPALTAFHMDDRGEFFR